MTQYNPTPRAVVACSDDAARMFLVVHLEDRGFAVEQAHRAEYLQEAALGADLAVVDVGMFLTLATGAEPLGAHEVVVLSRSATPAERKIVKAQGARHYFALPFHDAPGLASELDSIAARSMERAQSREATLV